MEKRELWQGSHSIGPYVCVVEWDGKTSRRELVNTGKMSLTNKREKINKKLKRGIVGFQQSYSAVRSLQQLGPGVLG